LTVYNKRLVARFYKFVMLTEACSSETTLSYSQLDEMFYFKSKQIFSATMSVKAKEASVSKSNWISNSLVLHVSIRYQEELEFEGIIEYSLIDLDTDTIVKVATT
jgi:hypothetical protein